MTLPLNALINARMQKFMEEGILDEIDREIAVFKLKYGARWLEHYQKQAINRARWEVSRASK